MNKSLAEELQVEVVDDTPETDKPFVKEEKKEEEVKETSEENELEGYSEKVQKRIKKMKYDYHEERRAKESAERMREEAIKFAENQKHENERLKKLIEVGGKALTSASQARVDSDLVTAEKLYKDAYDNGDSEGMLQAQKKIATLTYEKNKISETPVNGVWKEPSQQQPQQQQQQQQIPEADPKAVEWVQKNSWFQKPGYEEMTSLAYGVHEKLLKQGVDPRSEQYYNSIDKRMQEVFPDHFNVEQQTTTETPEEVETSQPETQRTANVVAPSQRTTGKAPRKIKLTASAVKLAKRLGLTNEQYAAQVLRESN
tara:strand:- start:638 stop:1576 length:939 start_codon:yes stop_codon:yes gene_type:complete